MCILILCFVLAECFLIVPLQGDVSFNLLECYVILMSFSQHWTPTIFWHFSQYSKAIKNRQHQKCTHALDMHSTNIFLWCIFCLEWAHTAFSFFWHSVLCADSWFYVYMSLSVEAIVAKSFWLSRLEAFHFKLLMSLLCQTCSDLSKIVLILAELCLIKSRLIKYHFFSASCCCWAPMNPLKYLNTAVDYWFPKRGRKTGLCDVVIHLQTA